MHAGRWFAALSVAVLTLAAPRADALTILPQEFTCPIGGEVFSQSMAASGTQFGQDFDLRPHGPIAAPWPLHRHRRSSHMQITLRRAREDDRLHVAARDAQHRAHRFEAAFVG